MFISPAYINYISHFQFYFNHELSDPAKDCHFRITFVSQSNQNLYLTVLAKLISCHLSQATFFMGASLPSTLYKIQGLLTKH